MNTVDVTPRMEVGNVEVNSGRRYRHKKSSGEYIVITVGWLEADLTPVVIYKSADPMMLAAIWVRPLAEFIDGRFEDITTATDLKLANKW